MFHLQIAFTAEVMGGKPFTWTSTHGYVSAASAGYALRHMTRPEVGMQWHRAWVAQSFNGGDYMLPVIGTERVNLSRNVSAIPELLERSGAFHS